MLITQSIVVTDGKREITQWSNNTISNQVDRLGTLIWN